MPNNLPQQLTSFVGREREVAEVIRLLASARLLTLTGAGGSGKTRLALQVVADLLDSFEDGVFFVSLAPISDTALVVPAIVQALGAREESGQTLLDTLKAFLGEKHLLLVLDNFEQVIEAAGEVSQLLTTCSHLKVLVTSRVPLRIRGEKEYAVSPLELPDPSHLPPLEKLTRYEAVRLFIERATDVKSDFKATNENALAVAEICVRLDGLPLAIELAAARMKVLPPHALLARLSSRLKILTGGARDLSARQQTLRGAIDWSYDLLDAGQKQLFRRMAVFNGGSTLAGLEAVCNSEGLQVEGQREVDVFEGVASLISNSLLEQREGSDGEPRFWMLETIHEYAREKLQESGETEALQREHALYFMKLAEEVEPKLKGPDQVLWFDRLEEEHNNLRAMLRWALTTGQVEIALRSAGALRRFWTTRGYAREGYAWLEGTLTESEIRAVPATIRAKALRAAGNLASVLMDESYERQIAYHQESIALYREVGDKAGVAAGLNSLGGIAAYQDDEQAKALFEESLAINRDLGDKHSIAVVLGNLAILEQQQFHYSAARSLWEESLAIRRELGVKDFIADALQNLGDILLMQSNYDEALSFFDEALVLAQELGSKNLVADILISLGFVARYQGNYAKARSLFEESLALSRQTDHRLDTAGALTHLGEIALFQDDVTTSLLLHEESLAMFREIGLKRGIAMALNGLGVIARYQGYMPKAYSMLNDALVTARMTAYKPSITLSLCNLGQVAYQMGDYEQATSLLVEGLMLSKQAEAKRDLCICLMGLGSVAAAQQRASHATHLFGAAEAALEARGAKLDPPYQVELGRSVYVARTQLGEEGFEKARQEGRAMSMEQAIELALSDMPEPEPAPGPPSAQSYPNDLTQREAEVLRLVAEGLTSAQIAERLFLSRNTVHAHLHTIYSKLGVNTRSAAARFATEHGLA